VHPSPASGARPTCSPSLSLPFLCSSHWPYLVLTAPTKTPVLDTDIYLNNSSCSCGVRRHHRHRVVHSQPYSLCFAPLRDHSSSFNILSEALARTGKHSLLSIRHLSPILALHNGTVIHAHSCLSASLLAPQFSLSSPFSVYLPVGLTLYLSQPPYRQQRGVTAH